MTISRRWRIPLLAVVSPVLIASVIASFLVWRGIVPNPFKSWEIITTTLEATFSPQRQHRLDEISVIAAKIEAETGFPADAMVAQWAIESDWGAKPVCQNNYFGIKLAMRHLAGCAHETIEVMTDRRIAIWNADHPGQPVTAGMRIAPQGGYQVRVTEQFADYHSLEDSCRDYATLIMSGTPYIGAWRAYLQSKDVRVLLDDLAGIYWTDPDYVSKAVAIMGEMDVKESIQVARQRGIPSPGWRPTNGLSPTAVAAISVGLGNVVIGLIGALLRAGKKAREADLNGRLSNIEAGLRVAVAESETRLQDRNRIDTRVIIKDNNSELELFFNGRYLKTEKFYEAHAEQLAEIKKMVEELKALKTPTVRLGGDKQ